MRARVELGDAIDRDDRRSVHLLRTVAAEHGPQIGLLRQRCDRVRRLRAAPLRRERQRRRLARSRALGA